MQMPRSVIATVLVFSIFSSTPVMAGPLGDLTCDGDVDVLDAVLAIRLALSLPVPEEMDGDGDGIPDSCPPELNCGAETELNEAGDTCVPLVTQADVDTAFDEGVASVDITTDNQGVADAAFEEGVLSLTDDLESANAQLETCTTDLTETTNQYNMNPCAAGIRRDLSQSAMVQGNSGKSFFYLPVVFSCNKKLQSMYR